MNEMHLKTLSEPRTLNSNPHPSYQYRFFSTADGCVSFLKLLINMALASNYVKANLTSISHGPTISNLATMKIGNYIFKNQV